MYIHLMGLLLKEIDSLNNLAPLNESRLNFTNKNQCMIIHADITYKKCITNESSITCSIHNERSLRQEYVYE